MKQQAEKTEDEAAGSDITISLGQIWSSVTSEIESIFATSERLRTSNIARTSTTNMATTANVPQPVTTLVLHSTVLETSLITVRVNTNGMPMPSSSSTSLTYSSTPSLLSSSSSSSSAPSTLTGALSSISPRSSIPQLVPTTANTQHVTLPVAASNTNSPSGPISTGTVDPIQSINTSTPPSQSQHNDHTGAAEHKRVIIGGLCGAIAGLVLIGLLLCLCVRRKATSRQEDVSSASEKGIRPTLARKWSELTSPKHSPAPVATHISPSGTTADIDGSRIRMSLSDWPRPFATGESFRESLGPGRLVVTNPDLSRPTTPSSDTAGSFLKRQRSALNAVLWGVNRAKASSPRPLSQYSQRGPSVVVDPSLSKDCVASHMHAPSYKSHSSLPIVQQHPPEDPFLTPPEESPPAESAAPETPRPRRPRIQPLQDAASVASRTLSNFGNALKNFRTKSSVRDSEASFERHSVLTFSSAGDQFRLDRGSVRYSVPDFEQQTTEKPGQHAAQLYEGT